MHQRSMFVLPGPAVIALVGLGALSAAADDFPLRFLDEPAAGEYSLLCPVTIDGDGELRIAFDAAETGEISCVRVAGGTVTLYRAAGDAAERVGAPRPFHATGDLEMTLQRRAGRVRLIAAGDVLLDVAWDAPIGGKVGVGSRGGLVAGEPLLQPAPEPMFHDDFTRDAGEMGEWTTVSGAFRNTAVQALGAEVERSANPFSLHVQADDESLATSGYWFWDSYHASASVKPRDAEEVGLCAYVQDAASYLALRWRAGGDAEPGARRLVLVRHGEERILAEAAGGFEPEEWYRLELRVVPGRVEALIDRDPALAADTTAFGQGGIGLWTRGGEALFDDARVSAPGALDIHGPGINPVFVADRIMAENEVFVARGFWRRGRLSGQYWHWGEFFDDATVAVPVELLGSEALGVLLRSDATDTVTGYRVTASGGEGSVTLDAARSGSRVAAATEPLQGADPLLFAVRGDTLTVSQGRRALLSYTDPDPIAGRSVALLNAPPAAVDVVTVTSSHFRDYPFGSGPTDWFRGKGTWDLTTRWPCELSWTFFGGTGSDNPVLWSKHNYRGDIVLEFFAGLQAQPERPRYPRPSDINATICGDGRSLGSGYSFVLAGWNNSRSAILRNGEIVAETPDVVFANTEPVPGTDMDFHRGWSRVRAEKLGNRIRFWVDGRPILQYTDPDPLPGGRVALWSFYNGLLLGRARLWYAEEGPASVVRVPRPRPTQLKPVPRTADAPEIFNDFETDAGEWRSAAAAPGTLLELDAETAAGGRRSLRVTNEDEGGAFGVYAVTTPFRIADWPVLSFDYRLTPDVKLNLYFYIYGEWHALKLTAEEFARDDVPVIGEVPNVQADGTWHHAEVNLLEPLQEMYPHLKAFPVQYVSVSPPWESYVRCGIGGNGRGVQYWIDNFRIGPPR